VNRKKSFGNRNRAAAHHDGHGRVCRHHHRRENGDGLLIETH